MDGGRAEGKLEAYRDYLTSVNVTDANGRLVNLDTAVINSVVERFQYPMEMEGEKEVTWEYANFYHNPWQQSCRSCPNS